MSTGTQFVLVAAACGALGLLVSIGYNLKRIASALERQLDEAAFDAKLREVAKHKPVPDSPCD